MHSNVAPIVRCNLSRFLENCCVEVWPGFCAGVYLQAIAAYRLP